MSLEYPSYFLVLTLLKDFVSSPLGILGTNFIIISWVH